jgi:NAD(P)-dependent dehydrogenase (short-subunit alcohol dehydrogenase family)
VNASTVRPERPVAVVTGGGRGIGAAVAAALASSGYDLLLTYATRARDADAVAGRCRELGAVAGTVGGDLADPASVAAVFAALDERFGRLDLLVNNAGVLPPPAPVAGIDAGRAGRTFAVNALAPLLCAREAVRRMGTSGGGRGRVIVNVSSRAAVRGAAGEFVDYAMSKAALDILTVGLAAEVAADGIRVVGVRPGLIATEMNSAPAQRGRLERLLTTVPMGRPGTAGEVAEAVRWLASDAAGYVTGVTLDVSGGR